MERQSLATQARREVMSLWMTCGWTDYSALTRLCEPDPVLQLALTNNQQSLVCL